MDGHTGPSALISVEIFKETVSFEDVNVVSSNAEVDCIRWKKF
jgi:hypothetical protein